MKKYLKALCAVVALAFTAACSHQEMDLEEEIQNEQVRIVPFSATVITAVETRATLVDNGHNGYEYRLQDDDRLYIWSNDEKIYGELSRVSGSDRSFSGYVTLEAGSELNGTTLNAVIKSSQDRILGSLTEFKENNFEPNYTSAIAASNEDAVQKFSYFKASNQYYSGMGVVFYFDGSQNSTFLSFDITLEDGTAEGVSVKDTIRNGGNVVRTGSVTTAKENDDKIHAKFVAGFPGGTTLSGATVSLGSGDPVKFGGSDPKELVANTFYGVNKSYYGYRITANAFGQDYSTYNRNIGDTFTLSGILKALNADSYIALISNCSRTNGDSVSVVPNGSDYTFTVVGTGESVFEMTVSMLGAVYVTINVQTKNTVTP